MFPKIAEFHNVNIQIFWKASGYHVHMIVLVFKSVIHNEAAEGRESERMLGEVPLQRPNTRTESCAFIDSTVTLGHAKQ